MIKKLIYLAFIPVIAVMLISCEKETLIADPDEPITDDVTNLSSEEMANCYIVQKQGKYKFLADNQFNFGAGLPVPPEIQPVDAKLIWQTEPGSISYVGIDMEAEKPYINFEVNKAKGNALIGALDKDGNIVWSWHIWMPETEIAGIVCESGYEVMNLNLGAINNIPGDADCYGMLYQWGRKDPFPASETLLGTTETVGAPLYDIDNNPIEITHSSWTDMGNNTLEYSISHPTEVISNYAQYYTSRDWLKAENSDDSLWGNPEGDLRDSDNNYPNKGRKTCYDPCPAGWRVAPPDVFRNCTSSSGYAWDFGDFNVKDINGDGDINIEDYVYGWEFIMNNLTSLYFPAASRYDGSYGMLMGSMSGLWGNYWSNSPSSSMSGGAFCSLAFQIKSQTGQDMVTVSPSASGSRADAYSIRCIRDKE